MESLINFNDKLHILFEEYGIVKTYAKGNLLIAEGEIEKHLYYIVTGAVRAFRLTDTEEQTVRFGYKGSIINSLASFITETPSELCIQAIRKSTIKIITKKKLYEMVYSDLDSTKQYISFLELLITQVIEREIDLLTLSPHKRLVRVLQRSPNLFQEVPLKYIASYLSMSAETLSRIRKS